MVLHGSAQLPSSCSVIWQMPKSPSWCHLVGKGPLKLWSLHVKTFQSWPHRNTQSYERNPPVPHSGIKARLNCCTASVWASSAPASGCSLSWSWPFWVTDLPWHPSHVLWGFQPDQRAQHCTLNKSISTLISQRLKTKGSCPPAMGSMYCLPNSSVQRRY